MSPKLSRDNDPHVRVTFIALVAACGVITVLTAAAFWLSYAHLAGVAGEHGLGGSAVRQWAWPATLDLFIVAGEVLMFVDSLKGRRGSWAIGLTVAGSMGSIGLNVSGVGVHAPLLDYVVAGVPPTAALLAFGALMHQVRDFIVSVSPKPVVPARDKGHGDRGTESVPAAVSPAPVVPGPVVPAVSPAPSPVVPVVSRPKASVPAAVSPQTVRVSATVSRLTSTSAPAVPAVSPSPVHVPGANAAVPADVLSNLTGVVRFLRDTGHTEDEIKTIVPTLPGHGGVKPDSLKKAIARTR